MRLTLLIASIALAAGSGLQAADTKDGAGVDHDSRSGVVCLKSDRFVAKEPGKAKVRKLGELPPGNLVLGVLRQQGDCIKPVIVRYGIGRSVEDDSHP